MSASSSRPAVTVIVPFAGDQAEGNALLAALERLTVREDDEIMVVDNTPQGVLPTAGPSGVTLLHAAEERSSYFARNAAAGRASNPWLLFLDADCVPEPGLIDEYFALAVDSDVGALAGRVRPVVRVDTLVSRYGAARQPNLHRTDLPYRRPFAVTANLLVRRQVWQELSGFHEGIRSCGDVDFTWRMQDRGWRLEFADRACVSHLQRETLSQLVRVNRRYGAGLRWLQARHPGELLRGRVAQFARPLVRSLLEAAKGAVAGDRQRAAFRLLDAVAAAALAAGYLLDNAPDRAHASPPIRSLGLRITVMVERFPEPFETFVANEVQALQRAGHAVTVEAISRPAAPQPMSRAALRVHYLEDDGIARRLSDLCWLVTRHPVRCLHDVASRPRWRREEAVIPLRGLAAPARRLHRRGREHIHVHFAREAALNGLRLARLLDRSWSVTAHAWDIYKQPANLVEKLESAHFAVGTCDYVVDHLRGLVSPDASARVHKVVMGVDGDRFRRREPYAAKGTVQAVGRLVEKKGFRYLIEAAARLQDLGVDHSVVIIGDGPLAGELGEHAGRLGVADSVELAGARRPAEIRDLLEEAALLVMPCVVARDGDRDSMPVVVKEALAMEVPVVASDEVGLPEVVRPQWGRLVPPGDSDALARSIQEVLSLTGEQRAAMGQAGRRFVVREFALGRQTDVLAGLIAAVSARDRSTTAMVR